VKFYAVKAGKTTGIFETWPECQESIKGFSGAEYKAFPTQEEAEAYLADKDIYAEKVKEDISKGYALAFCDGSFDSKQNRYSYGVLAIDKDLNEHAICGSAKNQKYLSSQNIIGEIFGAIHAMDWAISNGYSSLKIFHDYEGLSKWISGEWESKSEVAKMFVSLYKAKFAGILQVEFEKVVGHSHNKYNDKADELAKRALSDNSRIPVQGDSWYTVPYFSDGDLKKILNVMTEDHPEIGIASTEENAKFVYRLTFEKNRLTVTVFKTGGRKLLVQGNNSILFQIFTTYVNELKDVNAEQIIGSAYRTKIDAERVTKDFNDLFPSFHDDYPDNIKRLIRQAIINLSYYVESEDYSQYVFPVLRALEGHMKYLFGKSGITVASKIPFGMFDMDQASRRYYLPVSVHVPDQGIRTNLEECYNFYNATRHTIFHYGDILGTTDSTRLIGTKKEADELIKECLRLISE
jgi:ribonuclease HI